MRPCLPRFSCKRLRVQDLLQRPFLFLALVYHKKQNSSTVLLKNLLFVIQYYSCRIWKYFWWNMERAKKLNLIGQFLLLAATVVWGTSFFVLKTTIEQVPAFFVIAVRFLFSGLVMFFIFIKKNGLLIFVIKI